MMNLKVKMSFTFEDKLCEVDGVIKEKEDELFFMKINSMNLVLLVSNDPKIIVYSLEYEKNEEIKILEKNQTFLKRLYVFIRNHSAYRVKFLSLFGPIKKHSS